MLQLRITIDEQLLVNLHPDAMKDSDTFRNECLYTKAIDDVFQASDTVQSQDHAINAGAI